ncbi:MAG TPA: hypothetical protein VMB71_00250 [Acetobacteraceae bacterium]|nr:hypothetical protein [Acetobacteraceae bacterium]
MFTTDPEIVAIGEGLIARTLPKPAWTHAAHFAAVLWLLRCRPDLPARTHMPGLIRAYNEATGGANTDGEGYHETITIASIAAAAHYVAAHPHTPLHTLVNTLLAGPCGDKNWLLTHWSAATLFTPRARRSWVPPDLAPLPFPV